MPVTGSSLRKCGGELVRRFPWAEISDDTAVFLLDMFMTHFFMPNLVEFTFFEQSWPLPAQSTKAMRMHQVAAVTAKLDGEDGSPDLLAPVGEPCVQQRGPRR